MGCSSDRNSYNRGIGIYPGNPEEDFSPSLHVDNTYRNIALHRAAYSSSSHDYCLTAQLATDGITENVLPKYMEVETSAGKAVRREREWLIDSNIYTNKTFFGENAFIQLSMQNGWSELFDRLTANIYVSYLDENADGSHCIRVSGSKDGNSWTTLYTEESDRYFGKESRPRRHSDPDKANALGNQPLPTRKGLFTADFENNEDYSFIRLDMFMKGAEQWLITDIDLYNDGNHINLLSSKHFNSTWVCSSDEDKWLYVDLGNQAEFDKIILKWLKKTSSTLIQVSNDALRWKNIAETADNPSLTDTISIKAKGRYVRISPQGGTEACMLTELEIWGKGGVSSIAKDAPERSGNTIVLSGDNWKLRRADDSSWIDATVPGTVLSSYINIGAVPNPDYADNIFNISDSYFNSDFWYRKEFETDEVMKSGRTWLEFDGINWKAEIFLNKHRLGVIKGAFKHERFDISDILNEGVNTLDVKIIKNDNIGPVKEKNENDTGINGGILGYDNPTFHASIGWDWISTVRGRNIGIWNDVRVVTEGEVSLHSPFVQTVLPLPDTTSATLYPEVIAKNSSTKPCLGTLKGRIGTIEFEKSVILTAGEERIIRFMPEEYPQLEVQNPKLWWPNGYGEQNLYESSFSFEIDGKVSDQTEFNVGIRQVESDESDGVLVIHINGRRFIGRGGNWGFSEHNLNYRKREYETAVAYHADMNFTILRNWVGQTGDEELYDACDRYGIMVWQDFWLANPADGPDPDDTGMFLDNAEDLVKRIRKYPSLVLYCGRNEGFPPSDIDQGLRKIIKEWHPHMYYIPSSADGGVSGHGPYWALQPKEYFSYPAGNDKFHSERGMPSVMTYESMLRTFTRDALWPQNVQWGQHDYTLLGAQRAGSFNSIISHGYGEAEDAEEFAQLAQFVNYDGYRAMFESRSRNRKGLLLWMSHPAWPSMTWQTYDWYFDTNGAYYGCKKACEPLHIQWNCATDSIEVVNYSAGSLNDLTAHALIMNMDGQTIWEKETYLNSYEDTTIRCFRMEYPDEVSDVHFIKLYLKQNGKILSDNFYINGKEYGNHKAMRNMAKAKVKCRSSFRMGKDRKWTGTVTIENRSNVPAVMIHLNLKGKEDGQQILPAVYEDNYFSLMPGEKKTISIRWDDADSRGCKPMVKMTGYNI